MKGKHVVVGIVALVILFIIYGIVSWHIFKTATVFTHYRDCQPSPAPQSIFDHKAVERIWGKIFGYVCVTS